MNTECFRKCIFVGVHTKSRKAFSDTTEHLQLKNKINMRNEERNK